MSDRDPRDLWKNQPLEPFAVSLEALRARARRFQSRVWRRNLIEYAAAALVVVAFARMAVEAPVWPARFGAVLIAAGAVCVVVNLHRLARAAGRDETAAVESWADFHRTELVRQRDALRAIWRWYLGPLIPGVVVFCLSALAIPDRPLSTRLIGAFGALAFCALTFLAVAWVNARAADALQREIDELDAMREPEGGAALPLEEC